MTREVSRPQSGAAPLSARTLCLVVQAVRIMHQSRHPKQSLQHASRAGVVRFGNALEPLPAGDRCAHAGGGGDGGVSTVAARGATVKYRALTARSLCRPRPQRSRHRCRTHAAACCPSGDSFGQGTEARVRRLELEPSQQALSPAQFAHQSASASAHVVSAPRHVKMLCHLPRASSGALAPTVGSQCNAASRCARTPCSARVPLHMHMVSGSVLQWGIWACRASAGCHRSSPHAL